MLVRAVIVEDEAPNRENLARLIAGYCPAVELVAMCVSVAEGRERILELSPDLVFLDIRMPEANGFVLLESLPEINFEVIFVTAYDQYAIRAIRFSALDYLLKPIDTVELVKAVEKAVKVIDRKQENLRMKHLLQNKKREISDKVIALALSESIEFVEISSVIRCESDSNYTVFYLKEGGKLLISKTLKEYDELLSPYGFLRIHQSHLVNISEIKSFVKSDGGYIKMKNGDSIPISRQRREKVLKILRQF